MSAALPAGWTRDGNFLRRTYRLSGFAAAVALIDAIAVLAERANHHPDLHLTGYSRLEVALTTHDAGGVTEKDFALAAAIEGLPKDAR